MKKIVILTEGGEGRGFGHLTRCMAFYDYCQTQDVSVFFIVNDDDSIKDVLRNRDVKYVDWHNDVESIFDLVEGADVLWIDSYVITLACIEKLRGHVKQFVFLDDTNRLPYKQGILINGSLSFKDLGYSNDESMKYLLGPQYQLVRQEFVGLPKREVSKDLKKVFISFGGSDSQGMSGKVLAFLEEKYPDLEKHVVVGGSFKNSKNLKQSETPKTRIHSSLSADGMKNLMMDSDLAICSGGQILNELSLASLVPIVVGTADNQKNFISSWDKTGFIAYAGWWNDESLWESIKNCIEQLRDAQVRKEKVNNGIDVVSLNAAENIFNEIFNV